MSDLSSVRAEIKAWERSFKDSTGREPTIEDIKKLPVIAQKYKLYKKLSKIATPASTTSKSSTQISKPPSTPKSTSKSFTLLQSPRRVVEATAPLESFNPFSPKKGKGKQKEVPSLNTSKSPSNPFLSPRKSDSRSQSPPEVIPRPKSSEASLSIDGQPPTVPSSAILRARKRLRGEPVSPSPNKEKRRRVLSPNNLPFPKLRLKDSTDNSDSEEEQDDDVGGNSFVNDSPMKPSANGKSFTFLFEDNVKPMSTTDLFGGRSAESTSNALRPQQNPLSGMEDDMVGGSARTVKRSAGKEKSNGGSLVKSKLKTRTGSQSKLVQTTLPTHGSRSRGPSETLLERTSSKRTLSEIDASGDEETQNAKKPDSPISTHELLPPSPDSHASRRHSGKSKPQTTHGSRQQPKKKVKLRAGYNRGLGSKPDEDDGDNDEDISSDSFDLTHNVKLIPSSRSKHTTPPIEGEDHSEIEDDLILNYTRRGLPRGQGLASPGKQADVGYAFTEGKSLNEDETHQNDDLPPQLQRVLAVESLKSKKHDYEEEKIVKYLLSGRRIVHYDPRKGGEVWGIGEHDKDEFVEDEDRIFDEVEEWEGDPVPWEVGDLSESHYHPEEL